MARLTLATLLYGVICIGGMIGFYYLVAWFIDTIGPSHGLAFAAGAIASALLIWGAEAIEGREKRQREEDELL